MLHGGKSQDEQPGLVRVRCLECGALYEKPREGGSSAGTPAARCCGYVGWEHVDGAVTSGSVPPRIGAAPDAPTALTPPK